MSLAVELDASLEEKILPHLTKIVQTSIQHTAKVFSSYITPEKPNLNFSGVTPPITNTMSSAQLSRTTPFDMKIGFSKSKKVHRTKNGGWYLNIPMRHMTSGKNKMPRNIYDQARQLAPGSSLGVMGAKDKSWTGYEHKNNKYDALKRMITNTNSKYYTFRRVSNNSDPLSWWHPGFPTSSTVDKTPSSVDKKVIKSFIEATIKSELRRW